MLLGSFPMVFSFWSRCGDTGAVAARSTCFHLTSDFWGGFSLSPRSCQRVVCRLIHLPDGAEAPGRVGAGDAVLAVPFAIACCGAPCSSRNNQTPWSHHKNLASPSPHPLANRPLAVGGLFGRDLETRMPPAGSEEKWLCFLCPWPRCPSRLVLGPGCQLAPASACREPGVENNVTGSTGTRQQGAFNWGCLQVSPFIPSTSLGILYFVSWPSSGADFLLGKPSKKKKKKSQFYYRHKAEASPLG